MKVVAYNGFVFMIFFSLSHIMVVCFICVVPASHLIIFFNCRPTPVLDWLEFRGNSLYKMKFVITYEIKTQINTSGLPYHYALG